MICAFCKKDVNPLNYGRVKINDIQNIKVLDESVRTKTPRLNITLCADCNTELVTDLLNRAMRDHEEAISDHDVNAALYAATHQNCDENCLDCPRR